MQQYIARNEAIGSTPVRGPVYEAMMSLSRLAALVAESMEEQVTRSAALVADCLAAGGKVLVSGNGGSAADAQHFVAELIGRMCGERHSLPAISLSSDPSIVTALGNDYGYENVFSRQVEGLGRPGDVLIAISTSGRSPNILNAIRAATIGGMRTVALVGEGGDAVLEQCDCCIHIPSKETQRVQELHTAVLHAICEHVERGINSNFKSI